MSNIDNEATEYVNEVLGNLSRDTTYAKILALRKLVKTSHNAAIERVSSRMLKYYERVWHDEKFQDFLKTKAKLKKKKLHELTPEELRKIRSDFSKLK